MGDLAIAAYGTKLQSSDMETTPTFTDIAEITNISGPEETLDIEDATSHDSEDAYENVVATILRSGEVNLDVNYAPGTSSHQQVRTDMRDRFKRTYRLIFPDDQTSTFEFDAFVVNTSPEAPHAGVLTASISLKPTGPIVHVGVDDEE